MRLAAYAGVSTALAVGALIKAFSQRPNFYSATVYLSQSNACILILTNLALVCTISFIYGMQRLCYGKLRPIEIEQLSEKAWYAVLDTLLAMPSLKDDVGGWLLVVFVLLLAAKVWGWIAEGRVDILEQQPPADPRTFHIRLTASLTVSVLFNAVMFRYCVNGVLETARPGMMVIFAFEFAIQSVFAIFTACRYILALYEANVVALQTRQKVLERKAELRQERLQAIQEAEQDPANLVEPTDDDVDENEIDVPGWEEKRRYLFGLELATDCIKIFLYTVFFAFSLTFFGLPMHIMRDVYITVANFVKRIQDYSNYRRATRDMNIRYPDATAEELSHENTCIVCRDAMVPWEQTPAAGQQNQPRARMNEGLRAKKLPCGHILHLRCLKAWLERQQACPTCRRSVLPRLLLPREVAGNARPEANLLAQPQREHPGMVAAQPGAVAQQPARQAIPAENRMRWFGLGGIRLGFYNGPARDVQAALQRLQTAGPLAPTNGNRAVQRQWTLSNDDHLRTVELRLLQQAHNIDVDRAHVAHLRALEAEITRLRGLRFSPDSALASPAHDNPENPGRPVPQVPDPLNAPYFRYQPLPTAQPLVNGNAEMPAGLVLPEGWSLLPLHRVGYGVAPPLGQEMPLNNGATPSGPLYAYPVGQPGLSLDHNIAAQAATPSPQPAASQDTPPVVVEPEIALTAPGTAAPTLARAHDGQPSQPSPALSAVRPGTTTETERWNFSSLNSTRETSEASDPAASDTRAQPVAMEEVPDEDGS